MSARATLRFQLQRPMCVPRDVSAMPIKGCAEELRKHVRERYENNLAKPEREALRFYLLNHGLAEIRKRFDLDETLPEDVLKLCELYHEELNDLAIRAFAYLILICTREARHGNKNTALYQTLSAKFGGSAAAFHQKVAGTNSKFAQNALLDSAPEGTTIGQFAKQLVYVFYDKKNQPGGGFGGKKWGVIADVIDAYVHGKLTAGGMLDTVWTLAHNGGPIFNKGMCFSYYDASTLYKVLDVQASGQIPQLIHDRQAAGVTGAVDSHLIELWCKFSDVLGDCFRGYVDWWQVEVVAKQNHLDYYSLGALKQAQKSKHGVPDSAAKVEKAKAEAEAKAVAVADAAKKLKEVEFAKQYYTFGPAGATIEKVERKAS